MGSGAVLSTFEDLAPRASRLRWLLTDVDGVLTDGGLYYCADGECLKRFDSRDGLAVQLAREGGLDVGILSGRRSAPLERRARELGITQVMSGKSDKGKAFDGFVKRCRTTPAEVAYLGDDLQDLAVFSRIELSFAPSDAAPEVRDRASHVLAARGGEGAFREAVEILLRARGHWDRVAARYLS